ncbi:unnamed protein product [Vicia faba]|uniref:Uncharacterized protein n=1 Tax=Vicia faba TaxID=3906 RepID=A0AAV1AF50_VICFA|nr:unnamed protein product [Vicia faba]
MRVVPTKHSLEEFKGHLRVDIECVKILTPIPEVKQKKHPKVSSKRADISATTDEGPSNQVQEEIISDVPLAKRSRGIHIQEPPAHLQSCPYFSTKKPKKTKFARTTLSPKVVASPQPKVVVAAKPSKGTKIICLKTRSTAATTKVFPNQQESTHFSPDVGLQRNIVSKSKPIIEQQSIPPIPPIKSIA